MFGVLLSVSVLGSILGRDWIQRVLIYTSSPDSHKQYNLVLANPKKFTHSDRRASLQLISISLLVFTLSPLQLCSIPGKQVALCNLRGLPAARLIVPWPDWPWPGQKQKLGHYPPLDDGGVSSASWPVTYWRTDLLKTSIELSTCYKRISFISAEIYLRINSNHVVGINLSHQNVDKTGLVSYYI